MRVGISTACFYPQPLEEILPILAGAGVHAVEILIQKANSNRAFTNRLAYRPKAWGWMWFPCIPIPR